MSELSDLERRVTEAAIEWRRLDIEVGNVVEHFELDPLRDAVDALIAARLTADVNLVQEDYL